MVFSSPVFLFLFLPLVLLATLLAGSLKAKNTVLTVASLLFYAWGELGYVLVMLASILLNHLFGLWIDGTRGQPAQRTAVALAVIVNLGMLAFYKYANFLVDNINELLRLFEVPLIHLDPVHLPIGISFFTFQGMSYVIDVYRGDTPAHKRPGAIALYIALFPQLIAGPIVRYVDVAQQIDDRQVTLERYASGVRRFIIGLGKKLLVADTVARVSNAIFAIPHAHLPPSVAWLGTLAFSIQLYFDFSGYSDMAIGLGRLFGFEFMENFNMPYIARSIREFWSRWHISLTTWFRDYVYVPLGGNRGGTARTYRNLLLIFLLTGLWHGASWNFIVWGLFHGFFMVIERLGLGRLLERAPRLVGNLYMLVVLNLGWAFFQNTDITKAWHYFVSMLGLDPSASPLYYPSLHLTPDVVLMLVIGVLGSTPLPGLLLGRLRGAIRPASVMATAWRSLDTAFHLAVLLLCAMHMASSTFTPFLYFRF